MKIFSLIAIVMCLLVAGTFIPQKVLAALKTSGAKGMLAQGSLAPDFKLIDVVTGKTIARDDISGKKGLLVMFICRHCPYVQHVKGQLAAIGKEYQAKGLGVVAISANDPAEYALDAPASLKEMAITEGFTFPLLFDETQNVAKAYTAIATPDIFLFDSTKKLVYRGQVDDTRPNQGKQATGADLRAAIDNLLSGGAPPKDQKPSIGCSIKWKAGNEPAYSL